MPVRKRRAWIGTTPRKKKKKKRALCEREPDPPRGIAWAGRGGETDRGRYSAES